MKKNFQLFFLIIVSAVLFALSCQGGGNTDDNNQIIPTIQPTVPIVVIPTTVTTIPPIVEGRDIFPISGSSDLSVLQPIKITFSDWLDEGFKGTIILNGETIDIKYINIITNIITITPNDPDNSSLKWKKGTPYTGISISGFKTIYKTSIEDYIVDEYNFTTTDDENKQPEALIYSLDPKNGSSNVDPTTTKLKIEFTLELDSSIKGIVKLDDLIFGSNNITVEGSSIIVDTDDLGYGRTYKGIEVSGFKTKSSLGGAYVIYSFDGYSFSTKDTPTTPTTPTTSSPIVNSTSTTDGGNAPSTTSTVKPTTTTTNVVKPSTTTTVFEVPDIDVPSGEIAITRVAIEGLPSSWNGQNIIIAGEGIGGFPVAGGWGPDTVTIKGPVDGGVFHFIFTDPIFSNTGLNFTGSQTGANFAPNWGAKIGGGGNDGNIRLTNPKDGETYYLYCKIEGDKWTWELKREDGYVPTPNDEPPPPPVDWGDIIVPTQEESDNGGGYFHHFQKPYNGPVASPSIKTDVDWKKQIIYFIMVDKFYDGDPTNNPSTFHMSRPNYSNDGKPLDGKLDPRGHNGGDLQGIMDKVGYLKDLGITAIWISPIVQGQLSDDIWGSHHGYHAIDMASVDDRWVPGSMAGNPGAKYEFYKKFIKFMHDNGILVIQDIVVNHMGAIRVTAGAGTRNWDWWAPGFQTSKQEGAFLEDLFHTRESVGLGKPTKIDEWLFRDHRFKPPPPFDKASFYHDRGGMSAYDPWDQFEQATKGNMASLPDLATEELEVKNELIKIYKKYVAAGVDGFRIDTVKHVEPAFWPAFCSAMRQEANRVGTKHFFQFGEVWELDNYQNLKMFLDEAANNGMDSLLDFPSAKKIREASEWGGGLNIGERERVFTRGPINEEGGAKIHSLDGAVTFFDNHDMARYLAMIPDTSKLRNALTLLLTGIDRGIPCIYYGTEKEFLVVNKFFSNNRGEGEFHRIPMPDFNTSGETYNHLKNLIAQRKGSRALQMGSVSEMKRENNILSFTRKYENEEVIIAMDVGSSDIKPSKNTIQGKNFVGIKSGNTISLPSGSYTDLYNGGTASNSVTVPTGGIVIMKKN